MAHKVGFEVALNGNWDRRRRPRVPVTVSADLSKRLACGTPFAELG